MNRDEFVILLVDDEVGILEGLVKILSIRGYSAVTASTGMEAISILRNKKIDLAFLDLRLTDMDGIDVVKGIQPSDIPIVIMTAYASVETAVISMKIGVHDYIQKPFDNKDIIAIADRFYLEKTKGTDDTDDVSIQLSGNGLSRIIMESDQSRDVFRTISKVKDFNIPVLLLGESGTGKEVFAKLIHQQSSRRDKPFIGINCSAIPAELLESEMFGHEKGAFSGADQCKLGKLEVAGTGTLFMDEIGDMDPKLQAKMLRVIEEKTFERVGGIRPIPFDARIIASTNRDLKKLIALNEFRSDLYYRLKGIEISLTPLREREKDLEVLIQYFVNSFAEEYGKNITVSSEAVHHLKMYEWPGNVRELKNIVESAVLLADDYSLLLPESFRIDMIQGDFSDTRLIDEAEKNSIMTVLERHRFNRTLAAKDLRISRKTLYNKIKKYSLN